MGLHTINLNKMNLPMYEIERLARKHSHAFDAFGAVTIDAFNKNHDLYYTQRQAWSFTFGVD